MDLGVVINQEDKDKIAKRFSLLMGKGDGLLWPGVGVAWPFPQSVSKDGSILFDVTCGMKQIERVQMQNRLFSEFRNVYDFFGGGDSEETSGNFRYFTIRHFIFPNIKATCNGSAIIPTYLFTCFGGYGMKSDITREKNAKFINLLEKASCEISEEMNNKPCWYYATYRFNHNDMCFGNYWTD